MWDACPVSEAETAGGVRTEPAVPADSPPPAPGPAPSVPAGETPAPAAAGETPAPAAAGETPAPAAAGETPAPAAAGETPPPEPPALNVTRLLNEAASKSKIMWVEIPGGTTHPIWYVWHDDGDPRGTGPAAYVVSGPGEQSLPWLPETVHLLFRSKDSGGRLLATNASAREIAVGTPEWEAAVERLSAERLNATADAATAWAQGCTIHVLTPHGRPYQSPGDYPSDNGAERIVSAPGTTVGWRPWHLHGRPLIRLRMRKR